MIGRKSRALGALALVVVAAVTTPLRALAAPATFTNVYGGNAWYNNGRGDAGFADSGCNGTCPSWWTGNTAQWWYGSNSPALQYASGEVDTRGGVYLPIGPHPCDAPSTCFQHVAYTTASGYTGFDGVQPPDARTAFKRYGGPSATFVQCVYVYAPEPITYIATAYQSSAVPSYFWPAHDAIYASTWDGGKTVDWGVWDEDGIGLHQKVSVPGAVFNGSDVVGGANLVCIDVLPHAAQGGTTLTAALWVDGIKMGILSGFTQCNGCGSVNFGGAVPNDTCDKCVAKWYWTGFGADAGAAGAMVPCTQDTTWPWTTSAGGPTGSNPWYCDSASPLDMPGEEWLALTGTSPVQVPTQHNWTCYPAAGTPGGAVAMSGTAIVGAETCPTGYQLSQTPGWTYNNSTAGQPNPCSDTGFTAPGSWGASTWRWPGPLSGECKYMVPQPTCTPPDGVFGWVTQSVPYGLCLLAADIALFIDGIIDVVEPGPSLSQPVVSMWNDVVSQKVPFSLFGPAYGAVSGALAAPAQDWCWDSNDWSSALSDHLSTGTTALAPPPSANAHVCASTVVSAFAQPSPVGVSYRTIMSGIWAVSFCLMWIKLGVGRDAAAQTGLGRFLDVFDGSEGGA